MRIFGMNIFNLKSINYHIKSMLLSPLPLRVHLLQLMMKRFNLGTFKQRLKHEGVIYPYYAFGMYSAALQAKSLGLKKITVIEFGVGTGNGLMAMEKHGTEIKNLTGIDFEIYGFDTGKGLPKPTDYKDQCYFWKESDFKMDQKKLEKKLVFAKLIIGEIQSTIKHFIKDCLNSPIGFIGFDLDYYSSTIASFEIFNLNENLLLPRVECYMDDIGSNELLVASIGTGVLKAIYDFNSVSKEQKKILKKEGLKFTRTIPASWNEQMYIFHSFDHYQYNHPVTEN